MSQTEKMETNISLNLDYMHSIQTTTKYNTELEAEMV